MRPPVKKKLNDILARVRDLSSCYVAEMRYSDPEDRLIPRVSAIVIREGLWLCRLAEKLAKKVQVPADDNKAIAAARKYFEGLKETHSDDVAVNGFIFRVECDFVIHLDKVGKIAKRLADQIDVARQRYEEEDEEIAQEIAADMTA